MEIQVKIPDADAMHKTLKKALKGKPSVMFLAVKASRDQFWRILVRRYLSARSRGDKTRLMRDTGTVVQSYFPEERDGTHPWAALDSDNPAARIHEDDTKDRLMVIRAKNAKALFIPTVNRPVSQGVVPKTSSAAIPANSGGKFIFRRESRVLRRWPSKHALDQWKPAIIKAGVITFEREVVKRWGDGPWPQKEAK